MVEDHGAMTMGSKLATLMPRMGKYQVNQMEAGHVFIEYVRNAMVANCIPSKSFEVDLRNRRCGYKRFQTLHYPCAHVVAACTKVSHNVEQFIDEVYTFECLLRVWENELPMLPDLSTWEVPPTTFELALDKRLRRNPKGRP
ncbi:hypothetical protein GOBAR_DD02494 [Gossypium barbadense]|nr:hypothetical protein GOBAR_DD02494 [Gossypium barbadense]